MRKNKKTKIFFDNDFSVTKVVHLLPFVEKNGIPHISNAGKMALKQILFFSIREYKKKKELGEDSKRGKWEITRVSSPLPTTWISHREAKIDRHISRNSNGIGLC